MDLRPARGWQPPDTWTTRFTVIDSHTGGEPFRVVVDGPADLPGDTVLERRRFAQENLDHLRRVLMWEPRGHADMYGAWIGPPASPDGDLSVIFMHNDGFSTMCGHGIVALAKVVLDTGILSPTEPETELKIDTPAGRVVAAATVVNGSVTETRFRNVPSFATTLDQVVEVPEVGNVRYDLAFGGAFYAFVDAAASGVDMGDTAGLIAAGRAIKRALAGSTDVVHPEHDDLGFLYGVIFTGPAADPANHSRHVCVFADGEVDRSPTGTGVSARLALLHRREEVGTGEELGFESIVGSRFAGVVAGTTRVGPFDAVLPEVSGTAHIVGRSELWVDPADPLGWGFLLR